MYYYMCIHYTFFFVDEVKLEFSDVELSNRKFFMLYMFEMLGFFGKKYFNWIFIVVCVQIFKFSIFLIIFINIIEK